MNINTPRTRPYREFTFNEDRQNLNEERYPYHEQAKVLEKITIISLALRNFIFKIDKVLSELKSAFHTEVLDANTSDHSLVGFLVSNSSYEKNMHVANSVDDLQYEAIRINEIIRRSEFFYNCPRTLPTNFNGESIRQAEKAEHGFLVNWLTSNAYSGMASLNTIDQIRSVHSQIGQVKFEAEQILNRFDSMQNPFNPTHPY